jgi:hypothetical protein
MAPKRDPEQHLGKPDIVELHPRIMHTLHVMEGHAHLKSCKVKVADILRAQVHQNRGVSANGRIGIPDVAASLLYAADMLDLLPSVMQQMTKLEAALAAMEGKRKP